MSGDLLKIRKPGISRSLPGEEWGRSCKVMPWKQNMGVSGFEGPPSFWNPFFVGTKRNTIMLRGPPKKHPHVGILTCAMTSKHPPETNILNPGWFIRLLTFPRTTSPTSALPISHELTNKKHLRGPSHPTSKHILLNFPKGSVGTFARLYLSQKASQHTWTRA